MAKQKTEATKTEAKTDAPKKQAPPQPPKPKYGVPELAAALGVKASSVRVKLRNANIEKSGKLYGWDSKAEMQEVVNKLKAAKSVKGGKAEGSDDEGDDDEE